MSEPRKRLLPHAVGAVIVLALAAVTAGAAPAGAAASASSTCPNETIKVGLPRENLTVRLAAIGSVSCDEAHHLVRAYFHAADHGRCEGTHCIVQFAGGWSCGYFSAGESEAIGGGAIAGCFQQRTGARTRLYKILGYRGFVSPDRKVWCQDGELKPGVHEVGCVTGGVRPTRGGRVNGDGEVTLCTEDPAPLGFRSWRCFQNFERAAPVLGVGEEVEANGFRCASAADGITCTVTATGKGFRINRNEVVEAQSPGRVGALTASMRPTAGTARAG